MDIETLQHTKFTAEALEEIRQTRNVKFNAFKSRTSFNLSMVYQKRGDRPEIIDYRKSILTNNPVDPHRRLLEIPKGETVVLEYLWMDGKVGLIFMANVTGLDLPTRPTDVVKRQISESEALVKINNTEFSLMPAKFPLLMPPPKTGKVSVTATKHDVAVQLNILPE